MRIKQIISTVALAGLALALTGCIIPIPDSGLKVTNSWKGQVAKLQAAGATRQQVTNQLGSPAWDFPELGVIGYHWSGVEWSAFWVAGGFGGADFGVVEPTSHRLLWLNFDEQERLAHWKLSVRQQPETRTKWEYARRWRESVRPPPPPNPWRFEPSSPPPGKALVHVFWDKGNAASGFHTIRIDSLVSAEIRKGGFTTLVLEPGHHEIELLSKPLALDLAGDEVCFLNFQPENKTASQGAALTKCPEPKAVDRLKQLTFCK